MVGVMILRMSMMIVLLTIEIGLATRLLQVARSGKNRTLNAIVEALVLGVLLVDVVITIYVFVTAPLP